MRGLRLETPGQMAKGSLLGGHLKESDHARLTASCVAAHTRLSSLFPCSPQGEIHMPEISCSKVDNPTAFSTSTILRHHPPPGAKHVPPPSATPIPSGSHSPSPPPASPSPHPHPTICFVSVDLPALDPAYKWEQTVGGLLRLRCLELSRKI